MGKRKRSVDHQNQNAPSCSGSVAASDTVICSTGMELLSKEKSSPAADSHELKPLSSVMDVTNSPAKLLNARHHHSLGRTLFSKRSRHYFGHQYSRRSSVSNSSAATSLGKVAPFREGKLSFKFAGQCKSESGCHAENQEKSSTERIRSSSLVMDAVSADTVKMICGTCKKPLRRKHCFLGNAGSSSEPSVVAVLVCGHIYHADCLEQRTCLQDKRDPPCPLCLNLQPEAVQVE